MNDFVVVAITPIATPNPFGRPSICPSVRLSISIQTCIAAGDKMLLAVLLKSISHSLWINCRLSHSWLKAFRLIENTEQMTRIKTNINSDSTIIDVSTWMFFIFHIWLDGSVWWANDALILLLLDLSIWSPFRLDAWTFALLAKISTVDLSLLALFEARFVSLVLCCFSIFGSTVCFVVEGGTEVGWLGGGLGWMVDVEATMALAVSIKIGIDFDILPSFWKWKKLRRFSNNNKYVNGSVDDGWRWLTTTVKYVILLGFVNERLYLIHMNSLCKWNWNGLVTRKVEEL